MSLRPLPSAIPVLFAALILGGCASGDAAPVSDVEPPTAVDAPPVDSGDDSGVDDNAGDDAGDAGGSSSVALVTLPIDGGVAFPDVFFPTDAFLEGSYGTDTNANTEVWNVQLTSADPAAEVAAVEAAYAGAMALGSSEDPANGLYSRSFFDTASGLAIVYGWRGDVISLTVEADLD